MENKQHLKGLHEYVHKHKNLFLHCYLHYEEAEKGLREDGVQIEPDWPANMTLEYAYVSGDSDIDVMMLIDETLSWDIEQAALKSYKG